MTDPTGPRESAADIERMAAKWVARIDRAPDDEDAHRELELWAATDPRRAGAYARALAIDLHLDRSAALGEEFASNPVRTDQRTRRHILMIAASAAAVMFGGVGYRALSDRNAAVGNAIATAKGSSRKVALGEGSRITLNTATRLTPALTSTMRRIDLHGGEALFDVAKDPSRPFIVHVDDFQVRAVGTSFTVRRLDENSVRVVVSEGIVEVSRGETSLGQIHAGVSLMVNSTGGSVITRLDPQQIEGALAWRKGQLDLQGLTLGEAAAEFNRYSDVRIALADPDLANVGVAGMYAVNDPEGFARNAALSLGLTAIRRGNEVVIARK